MPSGGQIVLCLIILAGLLFLKHNLSPSPSSTPSLPKGWREVPDAYIFEMDLPGLQNEDVWVELGRGRDLFISGRRFAFSFPIPKGPRVEGFRANMNNGALAVIVFKDNSIFWQSFWE